ncbi:leucine-rich repeat-containing protein 70-like [Diorhabda sublineata]|uniref:leucine-rich repeat-containing protein 70-like n=1 Tax=Diorhabda sublineata TaxID=1163346 RepID=UPI0024E06884|nr:leucine-rich repeat-containing protein 70-like [Diorhabda sublineata]
MLSNRNGINVASTFLLIFTIFGISQNHVHSVTEFQHLNFRFLDKKSSLQCINCTIVTLKQKTFNFSIGNVFKIDLNNNQISNIEKGAFEMFTDLTYIDLSKNKISNISSDTFHSLSKLKHLNLGYNDIISFENVFSNMSNLQILNMEHNKLENLNGNEFRNLPFLKIINLSNNRIKLLKLNFNTFNNVRVILLHHNKIEVINKESFQEIWYVITLDLSYNKIKKIASRSLLSFHNLENLNISFNKLHSLSSDQIRSSINLYSLNASYNEIEIINITDFFSSLSVKYLDISNNYICNFLSSIFNQFSYVYIQNNYLSCEKETEIKKDLHIKDDNFFGSTSCKQYNKNRTFIDKEAKCKLKGNEGNEVIVTVITIIISAPLIIILLYCGFVKKRTLCRNTYFEDPGIYGDQWKSPTNADRALDIIDSVVHALTSSSDADNDN